MPWTLPAIVMLIIAATRGGNGGTLADAAFYESIRRALTPAATRSVTMADIPLAERRIAEPESPPKPAEPPSKAVEPAAKPDEPVVKAAEPVASESDWRARMAAARTSLESDELLAEALQGRVNGLTTQSINLDDPAQRAAVQTQRTRALTELDRLTRQVEKDKLAIVAIEEDARKKNIPPGWIR